MRTCLLAVIVICSGCTHMAQDDWTGRDKAQHFISSAFLSAAGNAYGERQNWHKDRSGSVGIMFAIGLGAAKELFDSREGGSGWSWKDFSWDVAGAATGYALWNLDR